VKDRLLSRRRPLITSPLEWQMTAAPVPHPVIPVLAERGGTQIQTPRPTLLVNTREQNPFNFSGFKGWFAGIEKRALVLGDYSVAGLEDVCVVERKDLSDLIHSCTVDRAAFIHRLRLMAEHPHRLLVITSAFSQVKSPESSLEDRSQPDDTVLSGHARGAAGAFRLQRDTRTGGRTGGFLSLPGSSLPLAGVQRLQTISVRQ